MINEKRRQEALEAMGVLDTPPDERVDRVARLAKEMFDVPMVSVSLLDRNRQWRKSKIGVADDEAPREDSFCDYTVRHNRTVVVEDAAASKEFAQNPFVLGDPHLRFYAAHPLYAPGGEPVGTLCIFDTVPRRFDEPKGALLKDLALWVQTELTQDQELDHAQVVQRSMGSRDIPSVPGYTVASGSFARGQLSGDFYQLLMHGPDLRITLADAMGKGAGPALVAAGVRASLRTAPDRSLTQAMAEADRLVDEDLGDTGMFVTAIHADLTPGTGQIRLVDAGHGLAFIVQADGGWQHLRSRNLPLGMGAGVAEEPEETLATLQPGDYFISCSDGLLDVLDPMDPFAHVEQVIRAAGAEGAVREAMHLARSQNATDDVTVVVVRRDP